MVRLRLTRVYGFALRAGGFEGLKAYRTADGSVQLFRPEKNMARLNVSCERLCIPKIDEEFAIEAIKALVRVDEDWVPSKEGTSCIYARIFLQTTYTLASMRQST